MIPAVAPAAATELATLRLSAAAREEPILALALPAMEFVVFVS